MWLVSNQVSDCILTYIAAKVLTSCFLTWIDCAPRLLLLQSSTLPSSQKCCQQSAKSKGSPSTALLSALQLYFCFHPIRNECVQLCTSLLIPHHLVVSVYARHACQLDLPLVRAGDMTINDLVLHNAKRCCSCNPWPA